jgi:hypothetical protein
VREGKAGLDRPTPASRRFHPPGTASGSMTLPVARPNSEANSRPTMSFEGPARPVDSDSFSGVLL